MNTRTDAPDAIAARQWICNICGWVYDEALGAPEHGIAASTRFEDIADDWFCPECGVGKTDFVLMD